MRSFDDVVVHVLVVNLRVQCVERTRCHAPVRLGELLADMALFQ